MLANYYSFFVDSCCMTWMSPLLPLELGCTILLDKGHLGHFIYIEVSNVYEICLDMSFIHYGCPLHSSC